MWSSDEAIRAWGAERRTSRGGQPAHPVLAILTALALRAVFRLAYRRTEGLIGSVVRLLGLELRVLNHTALSAGRRRWTCRGRSRAAGARGADDAAGGGAGSTYPPVDSTGPKPCGAGEWLVEKHGTRTRRSWKKLRLGVDADTGEIVAATLTDRDQSDASQVGPLLRRDRNGWDRSGSASSRTAAPPLSRNAPSIPAQVRVAPSNPSIPATGLPTTVPLPGGATRESPASGGRARSGTDRIWRVPIRPPGRTTTRGPRR